MSTRGSYLPPDQPTSTTTTTTTPAAAVAAACSTSSTSAASSSLRPFDFSGLGMGFGVYRPRRPSYTFATQESRSRNESYRCATRREHLDSVDVSDSLNDAAAMADHDDEDDNDDDDDDNDVTSPNHRRKTSYIKATKNARSNYKLPSFMNLKKQRGLRGAAVAEINNEKKCSKLNNKTCEATTCFELEPARTHEQSSSYYAEPTRVRESISSSCRLTSDDVGVGGVRIISMSEQEDDDVLDLETLRCNSNRNSFRRSSRGRRNSKFDAAVRDHHNGSHEDISMTEVTLIQTVPLRSENTTTTTNTASSFAANANGNLNFNNNPDNMTTTTTTNHNTNTNTTTTNTTTTTTTTTTRKSLSTSVGGVGRMVSSTLRFNKNLIILSISFILIYSSFQAIQNLQSSINTDSNLGPVTMMIVYIATVFSCLIAPTVINTLSAKWALCAGVLFFMAWFGANFHPTFYTLVPTSFLVGLAQGVVWSAESSYIHKLAFDWSKISRASVDDEVFRFHGIFLACFQTTHIWGNLISSLWLSQRRKDLKKEAADNMAAFASLMDVSMTDPALSGNSSYMQGGGGGGGGDYYGDGGDYGGGGGMDTLYLSKCGALSQCDGAPRLYPKLFEDDPLSGVLWRLMLFYIIFGVIALLLVVFLLDRIGARASPGLTPRQVIIQHTSQLVTHPTLRLLIPLLLFNGIQQGFMYLDYNKYFVTCSLGVHYVGYCMITLGVANVVGAVFVTLFAHRIPREVILGFGGILHIALMIGYLIWIPEDKPVLFCVLAGAWGLCDAIWQTQCNTLICLTCVEEPEVAFTNYRLVQSVGLALVFGMSTWACVSVKLYLLMVLLVVAIMFYVLAEYQLRHSDDDDVFEP